MKKVEPLARVQFTNAGWHLIRGLPQAAPSRLAPQAG
jgi:hypothetical protein